MVSISNLPASWAFLFSRDPLQLCPLPKQKPRECTGKKIKSYSSSHKCAAYIRNIVISSLSFFFLQLDGYASHRSFLDAAYQVRHKPVHSALWLESLPIKKNPWLFLPCYLVSQPFTRDDGNVFTYSLIGVKIVGKSRVILLNDNSGSLLDSLSSHAALVKYKHEH